MSLKVKDITKILEEYAPLRLKESYDNVGLMIGDPNCEITSILIALDCTMKVINEAYKNGCNFILTHHPLLFKKPSSITTESLQGKKIIEIIKNNINLYSSHTNLDSTKDGINDLVMKLLNLNNYEIIEVNRENFQYGEAGIGRIAILDSNITLAELCEKVKETFEVSSLRYSGDDSQIIKKVAVINGSGNDFLMKAKSLGADCIITGDTTYHYVSDLQEEGISIIDPGHFETEWPAMKVVAKWLENRIKSMGYSNDIIISKDTVSPYKYK
ncbi:dinuclear metal center YbgI/SA1388 family protein [Clostridium tetanomorphum]|uniref:GTP cyclohydrolase 1 type 2 homolog n=1 Tax=Clostridium tetanomorphum TaxID=1553 RepID=A0A923IZV3_CLOTT|nr:Nif3-like dinuclear metal center hexameric protein [Clostridium tetanomorphum]KAJ53877.1 NGG1-interacting factor 3 [Clostridium tetanomorphum DSM 665]MBC2397392.1 Nif3-like dinuclear metal center hexameric protein [Clostridium tetanomorphum]MBP1862612.1 dinuclear metal center YbgI/SA1388 family protein [Clostridium tetanomorphum]NRS85547.1 dinuclear metal center YbgI/SA1388 family protein [Clostridium tetanomorphum]NRZ96442.1 dinuclear metal center YbgI/SA1388 family protein [Clostridium te